MTIGESLYRFCLRLVIWLGIPGFRMVLCCFSHLRVWPCVLGVLTFICLRPYHDEMTQCCHLLYESANELIASHSSFVGLFLSCFCVVLVVCFALFVLLLRMAAHRATGPSPVLFCGSISRRPRVLIWN